MRTGRPRLYPERDGRGAPRIEVRLAPDLMEWVRARGGPDFIRRLLERERAMEAAEDCPPAEDAC